MSVRAYRVNKIEMEDDCSFNLWHDSEIMDMIEGDERTFNGLNQDGGGILEVHVDCLKKVLKEMEWHKVGEKIEDYRYDAIMADIAFAENQDNEWVKYDCF